MYLSGSKWNTRRRRRRSNPWRVLGLLLLIGALLYLNSFILPTAPPLFVSTAVPTRSPASLALEGESLFQAGKLAQAEAAYREAIAIDPQDPNHYIELARIQVFAGDYAEAVSNSSNAVLLDPNSARANAVMGWALDFQAFADPELATTLDALERVEKAVELDPDSALVRAYYAEIIIDDDLEAYVRAREQAELAVRLDPNLLEAQRALGYVWERTSNYAEAFEAYQNALRINPNLAVLHIALGNMYFVQGQVQEAIRSYTTATTLAPDDIVPNQLIARAYAQVGEFGKASQFAQAAVDLQPTNPRLHGDLGRMYYKNGEYDAAIASLSLAIEGGTDSEGRQVSGLPMDPGDPIVVEFYYMYGLALAKTAQCSLASDIAHSLLTNVPGEQDAVTNAEEILILCGEMQPRPTETPEG
jgi:tetratricopeptide (TPR) repeat protein